MTQIALITAMEKEFNALKSMYDFRQTPDGLQAQLGPDTVILVYAGIGKVNAAVMAERLCRLGSSWVISLGVAGGLDASLRQGDTVISTRVCYHDVVCGEPYLKGQIPQLPPYFETPAALPALMEDTVKVGLIVTGDQFVTDAAGLLRIKGDFPDALAVDMESAAIAHVCYLNQVRFLSVRMISDVVGVPCQVESYHKFWETCPAMLAERTAKLLDILLPVSVE